ncbi:Nitrilase [Candidatus Sulfopaludibacter sp. SbA6]|nr:Nitrilase [Candidatus Sulfopaludibacter sp. SbA6]
MFSEAFVAGYPLWVWFIPAGHTHPLRELYAEFLANAVAVPSTATALLCEAAKKAGVAVAIGVNEVNSEASCTTIYNTLLYISADGAILGKHRKVMPTGGEKLVWGLGDGSDLEVYDLPFGRLGGLLCWENYMPLARYAMSAWGTEIFVAPTWDRGEPWLSTGRHVAKEGRCYVIGCCTPMQKDDVPDRLAFKEKYLAAVEGWINPGDSVIVDPDGKVVAGPASQAETILYAELDRAKITGPRWQLDVAGHYARPDIFELIVHRGPKPLLTVSLDQGEGESTEAHSREARATS